MEKILVPPWSARIGLIPGDLIIIWL